MNPLIIDEDMIDRDDFDAQSIEDRDHDYNANSLRARFDVVHEGEEVEVMMILVTPYLDEREISEEIRYGYMNAAQIMHRCSYQHEDIEISCDVEYILTAGALEKLKDIRSEFVQENYENDLERIGREVSEFRDKIISERDIKMLDNLEEKYGCIRTDKSVEIIFHPFDEVVTLKLVIELGNDECAKEYIVTLDNESNSYLTLAKAKMAMTEKAEKLSSMCEIDRVVEKKTGEHRGDKAQELLDRIDRTAGEEKPAKPTTRQKI